MNAREVVWIFVHSRGEALEAGRPVGDESMDWVMAVRKGAITRATYCGF